MGHDIVEGIDLMGDAVERKKSALKTEFQDAVPQEMKLMSFAEIQGMDIAFEPPLIDGLLDRRDSLLLTGSSGIGKSLMRNCIALAVAAGTKLFDRFDVPEPKPVLILQSENNLKAEKTRISAMLDDNFLNEHEAYQEALGRIFTPFIDGDCRMAGNLTDPDFLETLGGMLAETKAGLLILDPLISYHRANENDNVQMREALDNLTTISNQYKCADLVVHHHGKGEHQGMNQSRGATAIIDWARGVLTLNKQAHEHKLLVKATHTKAGNFAISKPFLLEVDGPRIFSVEPDVLCPPSKVAEILEDIGGEADSKNKLTNALIEQLSISRRTALDAISRAEDFQVIRVQKGGGNSFRVTLAE